MCYYRDRSRNIQRNFRIARSTVSFFENRSEGRSSGQTSGTQISVLAKWDEANGFVPREDRRFEKPQNEPHGVTPAEK